MEVVPAANSGLMNCDFPLLMKKVAGPALARIDANLADLGTISVSANTHSNGFGTLEQGVNQRYKDYFLQFDAAANLELGKLLPKKQPYQFLFTQAFHNQ